MQPTKWDKTVSFTQTLGNQEGLDLDKEFDNGRLTVEEIRSNLGLIQRDDGALQNDSVSPDTLDSATIALISSTNWTVRGEWVTVTLYNVGDIVEVGATGSFFCVTQHISGASFAIDKAAGKWVTLSGVTAAELASTANGFGASLIGVEDAGAFYAGDDVESVLQEVASGLLHTFDTIALLRATSTAAFVSKQVAVLGFYAAGGVGGGIFNYDASDATTPDDGGIVIVDASSRRWKRVYVGPVDVSWFGVTSDGVNRGAALNTALQSGYTAYEWSGTIYCGATLITVPSGVSFSGRSMLPGNETGPVGDTLEHDNSTAICVKLNGSNDNQSASLRRCIVRRRGAAAAADKVGIQISGGYNFLMEDVFPYNHGIAYDFDAESPSSSISCHIRGVYAGRISGYYFKYNTWPELYLTDGRLGMNGDDDLEGEAYFLLTAPSGGSGGAGPNTLTVVSVQFNQGNVAGPKAWLEFDDVLSTIGNQKIFKFSNCHVENLTETVIRSSATSPYLEDLYLSQMFFNTPAASFFDLDAATQVYQVGIENCTLIVTDMTLAPTEGIAGMRIVGTQLNGGLSVTGPAGKVNTLIVDGCQFDDVPVLQGTWDYLYVHGSGGTPATNTAIPRISSSVIDVDIQNYDYLNKGGIFRNAYGYGAGGIHWVDYIARGTNAAKTASLLDDGGGEFETNAYDGSVYRQITAIRGQTNANMAAAVGRGKIIFSTAHGGSVAVDSWAVWSDGNLQPMADNAYSLGVGSFRTSALYSANGTVQTSDQREKTQIANSILGLDFINALRPVSFKFTVGGNVVKGQKFSYPAGQEIPAGFPVPSGAVETTVQLGRGKARKAFVFPAGEIPEGQPVPPGAIRGEIVTEPRAGQRTHYGLLAQQVKAVLDAAGVDDFGGWILTDLANPDSSQGLRYDQFVAPLVRAIQELTARIVALESK